MRLRDPDNTRVILVTLVEPTPVLDGTSLQSDRQRAGIHAWAWVLNNTVGAPRPATPLLKHRARAETTGTLMSDLSPRTALVPLLAEEPVGVPALRALPDQSALTSTNKLQRPRPRGDTSH